MSKDVGKKAPAKSNIPSGSASTMKTDFLKLSKKDQDRLIEVIEERELKGKKAPKQKGKGKKQEEEEEEEDL